MAVAPKELTSLASARRLTLKRLHGRTLPRPAVQCRPADSMWHCFDCKTWSAPHPEQISERSASSRPHRDGVAVLAPLIPGPRVGAMPAAWASSQAPTRPRWALETPAARPPGRPGAWMGHPLVHQGGVPIASHLRLRALGAPDSHEAFSFATQPSEPDPVRRALRARAASPEAKPDCSPSLGATKLRCTARQETRRSDRCSRACP